MSNIEDIREQKAIRAGFKLNMADGGDTRSTQCYSCGICTSSCPVSLVAGGLDPRRIVHLKNIGNLDIDLAGLSIWHCLECHRCGNLCPNRVAPWSLIASLRRKVWQERKISAEFYLRLQELKKELVTVLSNTLSLDRPPQCDELSQEWKRWAKPEEIPTPTTYSHPIQPKPRKHFAFNRMNQALCLTCRECSSACPICIANNGFDPLYFIRCYTLGLSPARASLWSCIQCESCSQACSQSVQGHLIIKALQEEQEEFFRIPFQIKIRTTRERVFSVYVSKVDALVAAMYGLAHGR